MSKSIDQKPPEWSPLRLIDVGGDVYVHIGKNVKPGDKGSNVLVYHWHTPLACSHCGKFPDASGDHSCNCPKRDGDCEHQPQNRWQLTACGLHDVISLEPLHLEASLACEDGCPSHGWIRDGRWTAA